MKHEDGYCDKCGCEAPVAWLTFDGREFCQTCAEGEMYHAVRVPTRPEARDDGR